jgi:hypothetical protein
MPAPRLAMVDGCLIELSSDRDGSWKYRSAGSNEIWSPPAPSFEAAKAAARQALAAPRTYHSDALGRVTIPGRDA